MNIKESERLKAGGFDGQVVPLAKLLPNALAALSEAMQPWLLKLRLHRRAPEEFDRIFAINVRAPFFIIQRALSLMPDGGRIINISSGVTWFATPATVYSMTKGALNVLRRSLANSLGARNITVNTISPGITGQTLDVNGGLFLGPNEQ